MNTLLDAPRSRPPGRSNPDKQVPLGPLAVPDLLSSGLILAEDWEALPVSTRAEMAQCADNRLLLARLREHGLLTEYQVSRLETGSSFGLVLGNYRVLERLGSGGMGTVFLAEHIRLRKQVAIKVLHPAHGEHVVLLERFYSEIRAVSRLQHPNVVTALDVGEVPSPDGHTLTLHYFVMEHVPGQDLEELIKAQGRLPVAKACDLIHQIADALVEADRQHLVHRDIKPSNIQVTPTGQAKLLDFGLARLACHRLTTPGIALGSLYYMAPEQALDASTVDIRADIYGLGSTLFWCLTGRTPFPAAGSAAEVLTRRLTQPAPDIGAVRPDLPPGLRTVVARMMAFRPEERYPSPRAVQDALLPYLRPELRDYAGAAFPAGSHPAAEREQGRQRVHHLLIVDDDEEVREFCKVLLQSDAVHCDEAANGLEALEAARARRYDLLLLDIDMPVMGGKEVLRRLREAPPSPHLKVILFSGRASCDDMAEMLLAGADDYLAKPFSVVQLRARIKAALRFKDTQERSDLLNQHLLTTTHELEQSICAREGNLVLLRNSLVLALSKLVEYRDSETGQHLVRLQRYCRYLAEEAARTPSFAEQIDANFIDMLVGCVPLHDIGKAIVPDHILLKPGKLDESERIIVQRHTVVGREALATITVQQGLSPAFLQMAIDIAGHHHERYDGQGYPDGLAGTDIPLAARIVAIGDVYDALRSRRAYKPSLSHSTAIQVITKGSAGQFDPALLTVFARCAHHFDQVFRELPD
jgi:response regulator RpfG family c-di-GMP phosphodiesterase/serine/threonine protein kinase